MKKIIYVLIIISVGLFVIGCGGDGCVPETDPYVIITPKSANLIIAETVQLNATVLPNTAVDKSVTWISSDPSVATVDSTGKVTAINVGTAVITAKTNVNNKQDTASINVTPVKILKDNSRFEYDTKSVDMRVFPTNVSGFNAVLEEETYKMKTASSGFATAFVQNTSDGSIYFAELNENGSKYDIKSEKYVAFPANPSTTYSQNYNKISYGDFTALKVEIKSKKTFNVGGKSYEAYEVKYTWTLDGDEFIESWWWSKELGWYVANDDCTLISSIIP